MNLPEFLSQETSGYIHLKDHRIGLEDIVHFYREGDTPEMLHLRFPTLTVPLLYKVIAFYLENQGAVDTYCQQEGEAVIRQRAAAAPGPSLEELRRRRDADRVPRGA
jgi:uncharacterized protein (DUF433 family)